MNQKKSEKLIFVEERSVVTEKLLDATIGAVVEFDPDEAELAGAFVEDALTAEDAKEGALDNFDDVIL